MSGLNYGNIGCSASKQSTSCRVDTVACFKISSQCAGEFNCFDSKLTINAVLHYIIAGFLLCSEFHLLLPFSIILVRSVCC